MPATVHLTAETVKALPAGATRYAVADDEERGLYVDILPGGTRTFFWRRSCDGLMVRRSLGEFPAQSVRGARDEAHDLNGQRRRGELDAPSTAPRLADFWTTFDRRHVEHLAATSQRAYRDVFIRHLHKFRRKRLDAITRQDIARLHASLGDTAGRPAADKARAVLSCLLNRAVEWGELTAVPPFPRPFGTAKRLRWYDREELDRLFAALDDAPPWFAVWCRVALFTGSRSAEVCAMRWDQLDLERHVWRRIQKGGGEAPTALASPVVALLRSWREVTDAAHLKRQKRRRFRCIISAIILWGSL